MSAQAVLSFEGVWKQFTVHRSEAPTLHAALVHPFRHWRQRTRFWALQNVHLDLSAGDMIGVVGPNGAGKSTLLRLAGGIGRPSSGRVRRRGTLGSMLSLGESFEPTLTGRENALTSAILAGYTRRQALARLPEIVAFSELEEFFDEPLRTYSSGMTLRLAFAVASTVQPDILLVDEVMAVGDLPFQRRCLDRMHELQESGVAVLLASHDLDQVKSVCGRAIWLDHGRIRAEGAADHVCGSYREAMRVETERRSPLPVERAPSTEPLRRGENRFGTLEVEIAAVRVLPEAVPQARASGSSPIRVEIDLEPHVPVESPIVGVSLHRVGDGVKILDVSTAGDGVELGTLHAPTTVVLMFDRLDADAGSYRLDIGVYERDWRYGYDYHWQAYSLEVLGTAGATFGPPRRWEVR